MTTKPRPYGLWDSPISPASLAEDRRLDAPQWDSDGHTLVWLEGRSNRGVLVAGGESADAPRDLTSDLSVRAEVGYGGGDFTVAGGHVYFVVHKVGRIFRQSLSGGAARPITPAFGKAAAPVVSPDGRWMVYIHTDEEHNDRVVAVDVEGKYWPRILAAGHDFYMQPRWSPDGRQLAFVAWDHPNMPWDGTLLYLASVEYGAHMPRLGPARVVAGGPHTAIFQPEFTLDGQTLLYVSDESGWGRICAHDLAANSRRWLTPDQVEHAQPAWVQGLRTYAVVADGESLVAAASEEGIVRLRHIELATGKVHPLDDLTEYGEAGQIVAAPQGRRIAFVASGPRTPSRVVVYDLTTRAARIVARASGETVPKSALAKCEPISWPTAGDETAHGLFYAPVSGEFHAPGAPPLVVIVHGGPTSQVRAGWRAEAQFFATRGYGVLFVNYRGSTGYGRQYMLRLRGAWGVCDVEDAISGAKLLAQTGRIDPSRTAILGGSAGGFTVLQALVDKPDSFTAGVCLYGVANQFTLAADTHKFESRYLDTLLGPLPEAAALYRLRSPVFHADKIRRPLAVFQGDIDQVVPREQSDSIVAALRRNGTPHVYHVYEGEGHGWRKRETIEHFYRSVEQFLRTHLLYA